MFTRTLTFVTVLAVWTTTPVPAIAQEYPAGIVSGPKAAFEIAAPEGWVLSSTAGQSQGLHCVLYLEGSSWSESPVIMYAKIASPEFTAYDTFAAWAVGKHEKDRPGFSSNRVGAGKTPEGRQFLINEHRGGNFDNLERVAYVQLPGAVAYIVFAARGEADFARHVAALSEAIESLRYRPEFIHPDNGRPDGG